MLENNCSSVDNHIPLLHAPFATHTNRTRGYMYYVRVNNNIYIIERHNPYLATPGHIRDLILKWCTHPYPPVDVQRLAAPIRIHPDVCSGVLELYFKSWLDRKNIKSLIVNGFRRF